MKLILTVVVAAVATVGAVYAYNKWLGGNA